MQLGRLPMGFEWRVAPADWTVGLDGTLHIVAGPRTDLFLDPAGRPAQLGALVLHAADHSWVKLALERSPEGQAMVVTRTGEGCAVTFDGLDYVAETLADIRDGS